jgi:tyrosine-protein kinase Etk/Wzc
MERTVEIGRLWDRVVARRREIVWLVAVATVLVGIVAFLLPPWYRAEASLLPPSEETSFGVGNLLKGIGLPGIKVPTQATPAEVLLAILESRRTGEEMVKRFDLQRVYRKRLMVDAVRELKRHARCGVDDVGIIRVSVEDRDRRRAADMANAYCEVLDRFNREVRSSKGRRTRVFLEERLAETRRDLAAAEQRLTDYQSRHKAIALSPAASSAVESGARLAAQRMALQVRLGVVRSYSLGTSDEERQITGQLAAIDRQLAGLPVTGIELVRLLRDFKTQEQLHTLLTAQFEEARITEVRDVSTVEQLDVASPPEKKSRPKRLTMMGLAFLFSLSAGVAYALIAGPREGRAGGEGPAAG